VFIFISCKTGKKHASNLHQSAKTPERGDLRVMFYNVENLFDIYNDSLTNDSEFLPDGKKHWNFNKYNKKLNNIYKTIVAVGTWEAPGIVGLCEIENRKVLEDLIEKTPLSKVGYKIIHKDSPDGRGIDVALLYRENKFSPISYDAIEINFPEENSRKTRDILYVKGKIHKKEILHIFVNHWPSRWGGQLKSEPKRMFVASVLKHTIDSIFAEDAEANIIITGDFNDDPDNKSLLKILEAKSNLDTIQEKQLYNLFYHYKESHAQGTLKYKGFWNYFDQFIVSGNLLEESKTNCSKTDAKIFSPDYLLETDNQYSGIKPNRTYFGSKYHDGYSDHLPVYLDLWKK
jgi:predicted extracellular nuclease